MISVQFTDLSTGIIIAWLWNFGDGSPNSTVRNPLHVYTQDILYNVTLTVTGAFGAVSMVTQPVDLTDIVTDIVLAFV